MKRFLGTLTVAGTIALGGTAYLGLSAGEAAAQSACMTQCRASGWTESRCSSYCLGNPTRVYGYYRRSGTDARQRSSGRFGGCGEYHYWNGVSCVDARGEAPSGN